MARATLYLRAPLSYSILRALYYIWRWSTSKKGGYYQTCNTQLHSGTSIQTRKEDEDRDEDRFTSSDEHGSTIGRW